MSEKPKKKSTKSKSTGKKASRSAKSRKGKIKSLPSQAVEEQSYIDELKKAERPVSGRKKGSPGDKSDHKKPVKDVQKTVEDDEEEFDPVAIDRGDHPMSLVGHLDELRSRFLTSLITIAVLTIGLFFVSDYLMSVITTPYILRDIKLNLFNLTEGFMLRIKAAFIAALLISIPLIIYEVWKYIMPAIGKKDRRFARLSIIAAVFLFYGGMALTYFFFLPATVQVLIQFNPPDMVNVISATKFLNFAVFFCLGMGLVCELPIVIMILTKLGIVTPEFLASKRKYAIVLIWIAAAIITPTPDPLNQTLVAVPLMILYEISVLVSKFIIIRKKKKAIQEG